MNFEIVTDSSCNLLEGLIDNFGLHVLPLTFTAEGDPNVYQSYLKGERTDLQKFYNMMREGKVFKTSLPSQTYTEELFRGLLEQGRDVLYIGFSSALSGTFEATSVIMKRLQAEYPDRKLYAVDTLAASGGEGLLIYHAVQLADEGASIEEVRDSVEQNKLHMAHWFTVDDLMYLYRGGRLSKGSAKAGSMLKIKPVLHVDDTGHLVSVEKATGRKKSLDALVKHLGKSALQPIDQQMVFITHGDCRKDAEYVADQAMSRYGVRHVIINYVDPVIGAHSGPGTVAVFFLADKR